jgi:arginyl-tRNA synthetase
MKTIISQLDTAFRAAIRAVTGLEADPLITPATNDRFGDYQSNAAMGLAKQAAASSGGKSNPRELAQRIVQHLDLGPMVSEVSIAGPGFINVRLSPTWLAAQLTAVAGDPRLGVEPAAAPLRVVIDYSGPNIAKQMHVGHLRSTVIGDALSRVIEFFGHEVIRQNHLGDWGTQFGMLIARLREIGLDTGAHIADLETFYREAKERFDSDPAFQDEARRTVVRLQRGEPEELAAWERIVEETRRHYQPLYERLGVLLRREHECGESFYNPLLPQAVADLRDKGIAVESEGAVVVFVQGYDTPLIIEKSGGGYLYATTDLAAIRYRTTQLGARRIIYTHDVRQSQHFAMVFAVARRAGWADGVDLEYAPFGAMLGEDGRPFKTRSGDTVKLKDLLDEAEERAFQLVSSKNPDLPEDQRRAIARAAGIGAVKYADLAKDRVGDYVFSWDRMLSLDGNTAPYMQYACARIRSIIRKAGGDTGDPAAITLDTPHEQMLARQILRLGEVLAVVERELKPHHLCGWLYDLATRFSAFYENCPVLASDERVRAGRLALCHLTSRALELGLDLLGIEHPEQM